MSVYKRNKNDVVKASQDISTKKYEHVICSMESAIGDTDGNTCYYFNI